MTIRRVLVLRTTNERAVLEELARLRSGPLLREYLFEYCFVFEEGDEITNPALKPSLMTTLGRVERGIDAFRPDLLVTHLGVAFRFYTDTYARLIPMLRHRHPGLDITADQLIDDKPFRHMGIEFDMNDEIRRLVELVS
jgi:hypothetical protein